MGDAEHHVSGPSRCRCAPLRAGRVSPSLPQPINSDTRATSVIRLPYPNAAQRLHTRAACARTPHGTTVARAAAVRGLRAQCRPRHASLPSSTAAAAHRASPWTWLNPACGSRLPYELQKSIGHRYQSPRPTWIRHRRFATGASRNTYAGAVIHNDAPAAADDATEPAAQALMLARPSISLCHLTLQAPNNAATDPTRATMLAGGRCFSLSNPSRTQ